MFRCQLSFFWCLYYVGLSLLHYFWEVKPTRFVASYARRHTMFWNINIVFKNLLFLFVAANWKGLENYKRGMNKDAYVRTFTRPKLLFVCCIVKCWHYKPTGVRHFKQSNQTTYYATKQRVHVLEITQQHGKPDWFYSITPHVLSENDSHTPTRLCHHYAYANPLFSSSSVYNPYAKMIAPGRPSSGSGLHRRWIDCHCVNFFFAHGEKLFT